MNPNPNLGKKATSRPTLPGFCLTSDFVSDRGERNQKGEPEESVLPDNATYSGKP